MTAQDYPVGNSVSELRHLFEMIEEQGYGDYPVDIEVWDPVQGKSLPGVITPHDAKVINFLPGEGGYVRLTCDVAPYPAEYFDDGLPGKPLPKF